MWPFSKVEKVDVEKKQDSEPEVVEESIIEIEDGVFDFVLETEEDQVDRHKTVKALIKTRQSAYSDLRAQLEEFKGQAITLMNGHGEVDEQGK